VNDDGMDAGEDVAHRTAATSAAQYRRSSSEKPSAFAYSGHRNAAPSGATDPRLDELADPDPQREVAATLRPHSAVVHHNQSLWR
jgi:hypothetical protein